MMVPLTRPPMTASCVSTSPCTAPSLPITTALPARTVPSTVPSMRSVPSVSQSPMTRIPGPMIEMTPSRGGCMVWLSFDIASPLVWRSFCLPNRPNITAA